MAQCAIRPRQSVNRTSNQGRADNRGSSERLLPFPKRKANDDPVELCDDDFVVVDTPVVSAATRDSLPSPKGPIPRDPDLAATVQRRPRSMPPAGSRRVVDEDVEEDVADQSLAPIAAAAAIHTARGRSRTMITVGSFGRSAMLTGAMDPAALLSVTAVDEAARDANDDDGAAGMTGLD
jgi:hypothetical protein